MSFGEERMASSFTSSKISSVDGISSTPPLNVSIHLPISTQMEGQRLRRHVGTLPKMAKLFCRAEDCVQENCSGITGLDEFTTLAMDPKLSYSGILYFHPSYVTIWVIICLLCSRTLSPNQLNAKSQNSASFFPAR